MENGPDAGPCTRPRYVRSPTRSARALVVNDLHSQLNLTEVSGVVRVSSLESLQLSVSDAARQGRAVSVAGGRHAMGGQQFASGDMVLDTTRMARILELDSDRGLVTVQAGAQWPGLIEQLADRQRTATRPWSIVQKQTAQPRGPLSSGP